MDDNELMLAMHNLLQQVEITRRVGPSAAYAVLAEALQNAADERGWFAGDDDVPTRHPAA